MNPLSLDQLTVIDLPPLDFVRTAAAAGYPFVSLFVHSPAPDFLPALDPALAGPLRAALAEAGVEIGNLECFDLSGDAPIRDFRGPIELGASLGARLATAINYRGTDPRRVAARFAEFAALCAESGLRACIEPFSTGQTRSLGDAVSLLRLSGAPAAGLVLDALHVFRSGASVEDVEALPEGLIAYAQLCDAPARAALDREGLEGEATAGRLDPGEGELPLARLIAAIPDGVILGVEVPNASRRAAGESARDRAMAAGNASRRLLASALRGDRHP